MHGYVVPSRIGTFACTTLQLEFSVYSGKKPCKNKYVKILESINKVKKKKKIGLRLRLQTFRDPGSNPALLWFDFSSTYLN